MAILHSSLIVPFFFLLLIITPSFLSDVAQTLAPTPVCTQQPDDELNKAPIINRSCSNSLTISSKDSGPSSNLLNQTSKTSNGSLPIPFNQTSKNSSGSLPIPFNLTSKGSGSLLNSYNQTSKDGKSSISNSSNITSKDGGSSNSSNSTNLISNVWGWNGRLHCYGKGCLSPLSSSTTTTTTTSSSSSQPQVELGIPCSYAIELLSIAGHQEKTSHAIWVPTSHTPSSSNHSQTWKIRFDSLHKANSIPPNVELKASILQDGPINSTHLQFALRGPWKAPHRGGCYYAITLENPTFSELWGPFMQSLMEESGNGLSVMDQNKVLEEEEGGDELPYNPLKKKGKKKRRHDKRSSNKRLAPTLQKCVNKLPWTGLLATALCYASRGGPLHSLGPCTAFSPIDLPTLITCVGALGNLNLNPNPNPNPNP